MKTIIINNMENSHKIGKNVMAKTIDLLQNVNVLGEKGKTSKNENIQFVGKKLRIQRKTDSFL